MWDHPITKASRDARGLLEEARRRWREAKAVWEAARTAENRRAWLDTVVELSKAQVEFAKMVNDTGP